MRIAAVLVLPVIALLAACATRPEASCELAAVPAGAVFGVRQGLDIATYPAEVQRGLTGCQRVWYGERQRPESMQVLATYYFDNGHVRRLVGKVPGGAGYDSHYRDGTLDASASQNLGQCPKASVVEERK